MNGIWWESRTVYLYCMRDERGRMPLVMSWEGAFSRRNLSQDTATQFVEKIRRQGGLGRESRSFFVIHKKSSFLFKDRAFWGSFLIGDFAPY